MTLKEAREGRGMALEEAAALLCVSPAKYAEYEANPGKLTIEQALYLCRVLNCGIDALFGVGVA